MASREDRAELLRDYFDVQLEFALTYAARAGLDRGDAITRYTNLHRRFGLGRLRPNGPAPAWGEYLDGVLRCPTRAARVELTVSFYTRSPEEAPPGGPGHFGCFGCEPPNPERVVRIHFANADRDGGTGPLHHSKVERRREDLTQLFGYIRETYPEAERLRGASWVYHLEAYRRLFPPAYVETRRTVTEGLRFEGMSSWGQFLDHRERVRPDVRKRFLENLDRLDTARPWDVFPYPALLVEAPLETFYAHYAIDASLSPRWPDT